MNWALVFILFSSWAIADTLQTSEITSKAIHERLLTFDSQDLSKITSANLLNGSCNIDKKIEVIDSRYLYKSTIAESDGSNRRWQADRIFRDLFKVGRIASANKLSPECLFDLLGLAVKEMVQKAHHQNIKNRCYQGLAELMKLSRDEKPDSCPEVAWQTCLDASLILQQLNDSIQSQKESVDKLIDNAKKLETEAKQNCLNCLENLNEVTAGTLKEDAKEIRSNVCCSLLLKKNYIKDKEQCPSQIDPEVSSHTDQEQAAACIERFINGLWLGLQALNPVEMIEALPELTTLLLELTTGKNRWETLNLIISGALKGATGYEHDVWKCFNSQAKFTYSCEIVGQTLFVAGVGTGIFKLIKALKAGTLSVKWASKTRDAIEKSKPAAIVQKNLASIRKIYPKLINQAESILKSSFAEIPKKFEELAAAHPQTIGRLNAYFVALAETRKAAKELLNVDKEIQKFLPEKISKELQDRKDNAARAFAEAQKSLSVKMTVAMKASLLTFAQKAAVSSPTGASPLADHLNEKNSSDSRSK